MEIFHRESSGCAPSVNLMLSEAVHHFFVLVVILFIRVMVMLGILSLVVVVIVHRVGRLNLSTSRLSENLSVV